MAEQKTKFFRISLIDDYTHRRIWAYRFTRAGLVVLVASFLVVLVLGIYCLIAFTPIRTTIPGYPDANSKRQAIQNAIKIDSLESTILQWELYSENLKRIVGGEAPLRLDSLIRVDDRSLGRTVSPEQRRQDSLLRAGVRQEEQFEVSGTSRKLPIEGEHFFTPLKGGVISQGYDRAIHPYVDLTAPAKSLVTAVLDGTVIFSGWDEDTGYTIQVQHAGDIISIYKHNQQLLKKAGDKVTAGTAIALLGNTGKLTTGDHLHFELWYKGEAVDPARYISF